MFSVFSIPNNFQSNLKMINSPEEAKNKSKGSKRKRSKSRQVSESQANKIVDTQQEAPAKFEKVTAGQKPPFKKSKKNKFNKERSDLNNISQEFKNGDEADVVAPKANKKKRKHISNDQAEIPESKAKGNEPNLIAPKTKKSKKHKHNRNELDSTNKKSKTHKHAFKAENTKSNKVDSSESEEEVYVNKEFQATTAKHNKTDVEISEIKKSNSGQNPVWNNPRMQEELNSRTLFVGNMAATIKKKQLMKFFSKFGKVQSVRLRSATPVHPGITKRVAVIKKLMHPKRTTLHSYIRFEKREDALEGLKANGTQYKGHHLRVQICSDTGKPDAKKAVFVGNLPFDVEDDDLWAALESCGKIQSVRVVRNAATGMGIGVGYVNFESSDSVELALQLEDVQIKNKVVRIKRYQERKPRKEKDNRQVKPNFDSNKPEKVTKQKDKPFVVTVKKTAFQGSQSNIKKKKHKVNKDLLLKLKLSQKIAPRPVQ